MTAKRVVLFSGHYYGSARRAGFHWLADSYRRLGWDVVFVTTALSHLSVLRRDHRLAYPVKREANRFVEVQPGLRSFVHWTVYHPANLRSSLANRLSEPIFRTYGRRLPPPIEEAVEVADILIFESTPGLLAARRARELNPGARLVYRVSDDLRVLRNHPVVIEEESRLAPAFDLVSVPTESLLERFRDRGNVALQPHGIERELFDAPCPRPYGKGVNAVFVGASRLDYDFVGWASRIAPSWTLHVIGPFGAMEGLENVVFHGELPFAETVPYLRHASVGLHTLSYSPGAECFRDSLKVLQYTYCGLGIVAPKFLHSSRSNVFYYQPGDDQSIAAALREAVAVDPESVDRSGIRDWSELALELAG